MYGVAARGYLASWRGDDPWLTSHLELRSPDGAVLPGYGWIFPLGNGEVNIGVGALSTSKRPADLALRPLISYYTDLRRDEWGFAGEPRAVSSALLPMGGAVSGVAGPNWMLIGDAAACVNPLNGEGIDYGLETGRLAAELLDSRDLSRVWPSLLQAHYGRGFSVARRLALLLTFQRFLPATGPLAMRSTTLMTIAVRVMANLVTDDDADWVARAWRAAGACRGCWIAGRRSADGSAACPREYPPVGAAHGMNRIDRIVDSRCSITSHPGYQREPAPTGRSLQFGPGGTVGAVM